MTTITHEKYNELQKKMDKLADEYVDTMAEIESNEGEMTSEWLDTHMAEIIKWADTQQNRAMWKRNAHHNWRAKRVRKALSLVR